MALKWEHYGDAASLRLPICEIYIHPRNEWNPDKSSWNAPSYIVVGYKITLLDGEYGDGENFAEEEVPPADMDTLKQQAIAFLREKIQETLTLLDEG
jgi:hypothetical protein